MKAALIEQICRDLEQRLETLQRAARDAHEAATDPGSKAESKYDTRNLEASYLASGQARQVGELAKALRCFQLLSLPDFSNHHAIEAGALVEVEGGGGRAHYLLVPTGGGMELAAGGILVTLLSPESRLYQKLLGMYSGDSLSEPYMTIVSIR